MVGFNLATVFEQVAERYPDAPALLDPDGTAIPWSAFERTADAVAAHLVATGLRRGARLAIMLRNEPAYLQAVFAAFKVGLLPVNVNYRYTAGELRDLFGRAGVGALVASSEFEPVISAAAQAIPTIWTGSTPASAGGVGWDEIVAAPPAGTAPSGYDNRSPDDQLLLFTGGTTGMPKGVVWRQDALLRLLASSEGDLADGPRPTPEVFVRRAVPGGRLLPAAPFMHGTGLFTSIGQLVKAGAVVCLPVRSFDPDTLLEAADATRATMLAIVGGGQGAPLAEALERRPRALPALQVILSSGAALSRHHKQRLLARLPNVTIVETLGASEGTGTGTAIARAGAVPETGRFLPGPDVILLDAAGVPLPVESAEPGLLAVGGPLPDGYFRDAAATARIYRRIDDVRYAVPGDWARRHADGTIELLGRGSGCVNTGGEKVYPAEVEAALLAIPGVLQAVVVGVPDERLGEAVHAVLVAAPDAPGDEALRAAVRASLAGYKVPRRFLRVADLPRTATGKPDHRALRDLARGSDPRPA